MTKTDEQAALEASYLHYCATGRKVLNADWLAAWESCLQSKASEPVAWMFSNEEGDDDFGNNYQALKNKHYMGGPIVPLYSVPKASEGAAKPTEEMIEAGMRAWQERDPENHYVIFTADVVAMWNAMCAAAPQTTGNEAMIYLGKCSHGVSFKTECTECDRVWLEHVTLPMVKRKCQHAHAHYSANPEHAKDAEALLGVLAQLIRLLTLLTKERT